MIQTIAVDHPRLLRALRAWRKTMPDDLLRAALLAPGEALAAYQQIAPDIDLGSVAHRQILPHVHYALAGVIADDPQAPLLRQLRLRNGLENRRVQVERDAIQDDFCRAGIDALLFKGSVLAYSVYPDPCCRIVGDIDVLIPEGAYADAAAKLKALGWSHTGYGGKNALKGRFVPGTSWAHPDFYMSIDVHTHISHYAVWPGADHLYWQEAVEFASGSTKIRTLRHEHALLQICCHGIAQNYHPPVRWAADATWILRANPSAFDWDTVLAASRHSRSGPILALALAYLKDRLGAEIPPQVLRDLASAPMGPAFATYCSYRLERPQTVRDGAEYFWAGFREARPSESLVERVRHLPLYVREAHGHGSTMAGLAHLMRKVLKGPRS